jgi:hypothetical protein
MADETEVVDEVTEETAVEETAVEETKSEDTATEVKADDATEKTGDEAVAKDTKTLLSDDEGDGAGGVPDEYEFTPPDDIGEIEMTDEVKAQFESFNVRAKDAGLSQDQYQKIVEGEIRRGREAVAQAVSDYQQRVNDWAEDTRADKELGGDDLAKNLSVSKKAMDTYGTPELKALFDAPSEKNPDGLGLGNHPEVIRLLHRVGAQLMEGGDLVDGDSGDAAAADASLRRMYPSMFKDEAA